MNESPEIREIREIYGGRVPVLLEAMAERDVLPVFWPMYRDLRDEGRGFRGPCVVRGIMVPLSSQCTNRYCFISHAARLHELGLDLEQIETIVAELRFPPTVTDHEKWNLVLRWAFLFGHPAVGSSAESNPSDRLIRDLLNGEEFLALFKIVSINDYLNRFSEFYADRIRVEDEPLLSPDAGGLKIPIPDLVHFHEQITAKEGEAGRPVVVICMYCRSIRDTEGRWRALEGVLATLDRNSLFSHGVCDDCFEREAGRRA